MPSAFEPFTSQAVVASIAPPSFLAAALIALIEGPEILGAKTRRELGKGLRTLHVARGGRRGRHFILFRVGAHEGRPAIEVLRLLHDSMDLVRHLPPEERET